MRRLTLALGLLAAPVQSTRVDLIEINHYVSHGGQLDQVIFWSLDESGECHVRAWRLRSKVVVSHRRGRMVITGAERGRIFLITSDSWGETWTLYDPEVADRRVVPVEQREGL